MPSVKPPKHNEKWMKWGMNALTVAWNVFRRPPPSPLPSLIDPLHSYGFPLLTPPSHTLSCPFVWVLESEFGRWKTNWSLENTQFRREWRELIDLHPLRMLTELTLWIVERGNLYFGILVWYLCQNSILALSALTIHQYFKQCTVHTCFFRSFTSFIFKDNLTWLW